ncbi:MAG: TIGR04348 family glycosyltransferase, partial [Burkholderiales bacterium]
MTPAAASSRTGNRHTAARYARFLRAAGYRVTILTSLETRRFDLVIALHAKKSRPSILAARALDPAVPILLVLTGTDLYRDIAIDRDARESLKQADRMIVLQAGGL